MFHPDCMSRTEKFKASQVVWGCISNKGIRKLKLVRGNKKALVSAVILDKC